MKKILVYASKINVELINKHFNPVKINFQLCDNRKWVCEMLFNKIPDVTHFVKEFTKYGSFVVMVQTKKLFDIYSYTRGNSILKLYEQDGKPFEENIFIS